MCLFWFPDDALLIETEAQQELLNMDVLVCGACRSTYHFVEEFSEHKRKCGSVKQQPLEKVRSCPRSDSAPTHNSHTSRSHSRT